MHRSFLFFFVLIFALAGCEPQANQEPQAKSTLPADTWFTLQIGGQPIRVQLALTEAERERGLMQRKELGPDDGMLFLFESPRQQSFWMFNTPLPLDIGYFTTDGALREIYPMYPHDRSPVESRRNDIRYCLEMNQGWFARNAIRPGAQLDRVALRNAVIERGFAPGRFGL